MADNKQRFKATVKVTSQTTYKPKKNDVKKEFDNPYRTSNYSSTKNYNKKDLVREAKKDALNKKYERTPNRNDIKEIKDNNINRPVNYNQTNMNSFLNKRKSPYRDSNNNEEIINNSYPNEEVNDNKEDQTSNEPNENNNTETTRPSDLQPKDDLEEKEGKQSLKNRLTNKAKNLIGNKGAKKAKENAKAVVKKKALSIIAKHPMTLAIIGILFLILLIIVVVIGGGSIVGSAYGSSYCGGEVFDLTSIGDTSTKTWERGLRSWASPVYDFFNEYETYTDVDGFLRHGEDYVVALGQAFGTKKGTRYEVLMESGQTFTIILGDSKNYSDSNYSETGLYHVLTLNGKEYPNVLEFLMGCTEPSVDTGSLAPNLGKYSGDYKACPSAVDNNNVINSTFPGNITRITKIVDDSECNYNYLGEYTERTSNLYSDKKALNKIFELSPEVKATYNSQYKYECVTYVKLRAVEILANNSVLTDEQKKSAISDIGSALGNARDYTHNNSALKNFGYDSSCSTFKAGSIITYYGNGALCYGYYCGHVGIIESVDEKKKTYVLSDHYNDLQGNVRYQTIKMGSNIFGGCKNITYLLDYKG